MNLRTGRNTTAPDRLTTGVQQLHSQVGVFLAYAWYQDAERRTRAGAPH